MTISKRLYANNAKTTLVSAASPTDTVLQVSDGSRFPTPTTGQYFLVTLEAAGNIEIVEVHNRTGNAFTGCIRGRENSTSMAFPAGARVDNRATAATYTSFVRTSDMLASIDSIDSLDTPANSDSDSYVCHSNDDYGNPIIAIQDDSISWRFNTHRLISVTGSAESGTATSMSYTGIDSFVPIVVPGKYLIQFFTGNNIGLVRNITGSSTGVINWTNALPNTVAASDQFEVYKSDASTITELLSSADDSLIYPILLSE